MKTAGSISLQKQTLHNRLNQATHITWHGMLSLLALMHVLLYICLSALRGFASRPLRDAEFFRKAIKAKMALPCTPEYVVTPVKTHGQNVEYQSWPYLSPIDWLEKLMIDNRDALVPWEPSSIKDFWKTWLKDHPLDEFHDGNWPLERIIPLHLWGDEGTLRANSWLLVTLQSALSPPEVRNLSQASRYPLFSFPVEAYVKDPETNVNLSLEMLLEKISSDFNKLLIEGFATKHGQFFGRLIALKGDWKWLVQALNLVRTPGSDMICPYCHAGKTNMLFTNVREDAAWANTLFSTAPWDVFPNLMGIKFFRLEMVIFDLMHVWHLGVGRDIAGTCIKELTKAKTFVGSKIDDRLQSAYESLRSWARENNKALAIKRFTKENVYWYSDACPESCTILSHTIILVLFVKAKVFAFLHVICAA